MLTLHVHEKFPYPVFVDEETYQGTLSRKQKDQIKTLHKKGGFYDYRDPDCHLILVNGYIKACFSWYIKHEARDIITHALAGLPDLDAHLRRVQNTVKGKIEYHLCKANSRFYVVLPIHLFPLAEEQEHSLSLFSTPKTNHEVMNIIKRINIKDMT